MLKVLLRRQMTEIFRSYFYDAKKNRRRSPTQTVLFLLLFAVLMGLVCFLFGGMAWLLGSASAAAGAGFFYFLIFSLLAVVLGTFGSVFNTYSGLYLSKDNDLLLSLPIPVSVIMISRLLGVYLMGVLYAAAVMAPAILMYQITGGFSLPALLGSLWLFILVTLLVFILSCGLGYLVALLSRRLKNKSFFVVLLSLLFIGIYFFAVSKMQTFLLKMAEQTGEIAAKVKASAYPLYLFGRVGEGDLLAALFYTLVVCALLFLTLWLISRSFLAIATTPQAHARAGAVKREDRAGSVPGALFRKEVGRFLASPIYILNCGLGVLLLPVAGVFLLIRGSALAAGWESIMGEGAGGLQALACAAVCMMATMIDTAAPSVSLEGKNLWLVQSLPVRPFAVLRAKLRLQLVLSAVPALFVAVVSAAVFPGSIPERLLSVVLSLLCVTLFALFDLWVGLLRANLTYTNEIVPIKQSMAVFLALFGGWGYALLLAGGYFLLARFISQTLYLCLFSLFTAGLSFVLYRWLKTKGAIHFSNL